MDKDDKFRINALNGYLRTVYWGYQLFDETGGKIGKREVMDSIGAVNVLLGFPVPTDPTALEFKLINAASAELYFGSLGAGDWDKDVSDPGALMTGLWQYGIPNRVPGSGKGHHEHQDIQRHLERQTTAA